MPSEVLRMPLTELLVFIATVHWKTKSTVKGIAEASKALWRTQKYCMMLCYSWVSLMGQCVLEGRQHVAILCPGWHRGQVRNCLKWYVLWMILRKLCC